MRKCLARTVSRRNSEGVVGNIEAQISFDFFLRSSSVGPAVFHVRRDRKKCFVRYGCEGF